MKPGALVGILEFSEPTGEAFGMLGAAAGMMIRHVVPFVGGLLSGHPRMYRHLQNSIENFPAPEEFRSRIADLECDSDGSSSTTTTPGIKSYRVEDIQHMNFGSVQLYSLHVIKTGDVEPLVEPTTVTEEESTISDATNEETIQAV
jgi:ubiE/COQ5 methyltransferase family